MRHNGKFVRGCPFFGQLNANPSIRRARRVCRRRLLAYSRFVNREHALDPIAIIDFETTAQAIRGYVQSLHEQ